MRSRRVLFLIAPAVLLGFGCANPGYDRDSTRTKLERAGLSEEQARCVTRGLEVELGARRLDTNAVPTETEFEDALAVLDECNVEVNSDAAGSS